MSKITRKVLSLLLVATAILGSTMSASAFVGNSAQMDAQNYYGLSDEAVEFLEAHDVAIDAFASAAAPSLSVTSYSTASNSVTANNPNDYNGAILSLIDKADAYGFTDEQIQAYVQGLLENPTEVVGPPAGASVGIIPFAANRPGDSGVGYEVKSKNGFYESTAFAYLPSVSLSTDSGAYMMYTFNELIDIGICYSYGYSGYAWRGFYMIDGVMISDTTVIPASANSCVYFDAIVTTNGYARLRVLDGNNFNTVYYDLSYYVAGRGVTRSNANLNRQITMTSATNNFSNGATCLNARFSQAYLYNSSGYALASSANTVSTRVGRFGTNNTTANKVTVNSSAPWSAENISINFN